MNSCRKSICFNTFWRLTTLRGLLIAPLLLFLACSSSSKTPEEIKPKELSNKERTSAVDRPIVQVEKSMNFSSNDVFSALLDSLHQRNISVLGMSEERGEIQTQWVNISDRLCEGGITSSAPVACKVKFHFSVRPLTPIASQLKARYQEICSFNEDIAVECPNSNAEKLLKELASVRP